MNALLVARCRSSCGRNRRRRGEGDGEPFYFPSWGTAQRQTERGGGGRRGQGRVVKRRFARTKLHPPRASRRFCARGVIMLHFSLPQTILSGSHSYDSSCSPKVLPTLVSIPHLPWWEWKRLKGCVFSPPFLLPVLGGPKEARKRNLSIASIPVCDHIFIIRDNR